MKYSFLLRIVFLLTLSAAFLLFCAVPNLDAAELVLSRNNAPHDGEYTGVVNFAIEPGFENVKVAVTVDGQRVATNLLSPWRLAVDLGPQPVEHKITVTVTGSGGKRSQWTETINRGNLPLSVTVQHVSARTFEALATSPKDDPIEIVELWHNGQVALSLNQAPYRFEVPEAVLAGGFVQVTARTKSGEEAADFWSPGGRIVAQELQVRIVPIFVSVVDKDGNTQDDVKRSQFRVLDNESEATIVEFGKAFDQPISIALLIDASASMTYSIKHASKAALDFSERALKPGDRASVTAIQDVPRRKQALSDDRDLVAKAIRGIEPAGATALYDAVIAAIRELREEKNRRAVVVLTDGGDTSSNYSFDDAERTAREAGIPIYFIAYEGGDKAAQQLDQLRYLAGETGGFLATATEQSLGAKYEAIERDLRAQFAIKYRISDFGKSNEWRPIRVVLDSPKLSARTIRGYFIP